MVDDPTNETGNLPALPDDPGQFILYQTQDGRTRVECRFQNETIWLSQAVMAELYQKDVRTINEHLKSIYSDGELAPEATIRKFRIVRREGSREVTRPIEHYNLDAILAVGYRVRSQRGVQFRRWATERLREYLLKGFVLDDERLKNPPAPGLGVPDYFDIRSSEKVFWRKVLDIYAKSIDYDPTTDLSHPFFATVQNKMHRAAHGHTTAEIMAELADAAGDRRERYRLYMVTNCGSNALHDNGRKTPCDLNGIKCPRLPITTSPWTH